MLKMLKLIISLTFVVSIAESCFYTYPPTQSVDCIIYSEKKSFTSKIALKKGDKGQQYYEISLINRGQVS